MSMTSAQTAVSLTLSKSATAKNYVFSVWLTAASAGTLTLSLTGISTHPTISYTAGGPKYYEVKIPVSTPWCARAARTFLRLATLNVLRKLYNGGSEWQNDYGNMPDYYQTYYRNYDAAIGRWLGLILILKVRRV